MPQKPIVKKQMPSAKTKIKGKSILDKIAPVSFQDNTFKMSIYGRSGTGKTTLACTFPKPLLIVGFEDGTKSVHNVEGVKFVQIDKTSDIPELISGVDGDYKSYLIDTASSLQDLVLKEVLDLDELPTQLSWGIASRENWGQVALKTKEFLRAFMNLSGNVVIAAQEREFNNSNGESEIIVPYVGSALSPSVAGWLNPASDYICQTFLREIIEEKITKIGGKPVKTKVKTGKMEYCLRIGPSDVFTTKFRIPKGIPLPETLVDPSYDKIKKLILGKV